MCAWGYRFPHLKSRIWQDSSQVSISIVINWLLWLLSQWSSQPHSQTSFLIYLFHSTWRVSVGGWVCTEDSWRTPQQRICFWGSGSPIVFLFFLHHKLASPWDSECVSCLCSPFPKECWGYRCVFPHQGFPEGSGVEVRSPGLFEECFHALKCLLSPAAYFEIGDLSPQDISGALVHTWSWSYRHFHFIWG